MLWRILKYIQHLFYLKFRRGHGIHSPYLFNFINKVVFNGAEQQVPKEILGIHRELKKEKSKIPAGKLGANSSVDASKERSVGSFVRFSSVTGKYGALLYRITGWFLPDVIIELGSGLGISTLYLASGSMGSALHSIEGDRHRASFAESLLSRNNLESASIHCGEMGERLDYLQPLIKGRFVAFVDGNHQYKPTLAYVRKLLEAAGDEAIIILDDIYWSKEMYEAWREVISWKEVRVSIDLYQMGILLLRPDLDKADIKIKF
jgi:predicted O-methyltransferase YrrM